MFVWADNYRDLFSDAVFWKSLYNTFFFAAFAIPLSFLISFFLAVLLNFDVPARGILRTVFFLPSLMPMVCLAVLWQWMLNGDVGLINQSIAPGLRGINHVLQTHLTAPNWLQDARFAKWGIIFTTLWGVGQAVVIYLAGLQDVPRYLYEAAEIDGAGFWLKTHPHQPARALAGHLLQFAHGADRLSPGVRRALRDDQRRRRSRAVALVFMATYLYENAFDYWNMGYACAIGVVMFGLILLITYLATKLSERHVFYAGN